MKIVYFSVTGQTKRFVKKLSLKDTYEIDPIDPEIEVGEPFVLIVPTYEKDITEPVTDFLYYGSNQEQLQGVAGTGNRNFAQLFVFTAKDISKEFNVPLLYTFEFNGTTKDVTNFEKAVKKIES
ncbi:ribonucleotide reductase stimulatory protein [Ligilactobacillus acidipiscis DSM 15836]|jgi:protein involved in ribonucleotide reduction|uniref:Ribonucleotide reductase stimulatory protein n=2 Tax=Ligilactobacillus acidipiscis TaxID=89059 RepID=A0A0R2K2K8_9LACO|nr:class Ib ribonucleoside-diphosphate reductase assembly flavoprotein NrdI [Ligilactobacillus acidipiscis]KRM28782.1 ribonucleotide reductase stimulatory protein [Ligilactobacillus acidipiscis DSM 15836]KRN83842.1 ribonucleotide reductase stimulatory protein [Ligilactobacillus acidipiscis]MCI1925229.1 class Ib ribonucleoside-diphosphate reductase assembly flavoprotein NrdI [Ligilactobacillus acidipiscis]MCI1954110.1 class Ib ribonucleoside-diphosphate reductase assembly flavoprotein NrdI [Ligi